MIRLTGIALCCVLWAAFSYGQTVKGTIKDTSGKAVAYATVSLKQNAAIVAYAVTDSKGSYVLQVPPGTAADSLSVAVRCIGYQSAAKNIAGFGVPVDFTLAGVADELKEVVIKRSRPVLVTHGDTLGYKVSDFASPQDRTIGDVIKKLPGISVAADGTISYNNRPVSTVYKAAITCWTTNTASPPTPSRRVR